MFLPILCALESFFAQFLTFLKKQLGPCFYNVYLNLQQSGMGEDAALTIEQAALTAVNSTPVPPALY